MQIQSGKKGTEKDSKGRPRITPEGGSLTQSVRNKQGEEVSSQGSGAMNLYGLKGKGQKKRMNLTLHIKL